MKHVIPIQNIEQIEIELVNFNKETGWTLFDINFHGPLHGKFTLTGTTIDMINDEVKKITKKVFRKD